MEGEFFDSGGLGEGEGTNADNVLVLPGWLSSVLALGEGLGDSTGLGPGGDCPSAGERLSTEAATEAHGGEGCQGEGSEAGR